MNSDIYEKMKQRQQLYEKKLQFLQEQQTHQEAMTLKEKPTISKQSQRIIKNKQEVVNVIERLQTKQKKQTVDNMELMKKKASVHSNDVQTIFLNLYQDGIERQMRKKSLEQNEIVQSQVPLSQNTLRSVINLLKREYQKAISDVLEAKEEAFFTEEISPDFNLLMAEKLSLEQTKKVLISMNFIKPTNSKKKNQSDPFMLQVWQDLNNLQRNALTAKLLFQFLLSVMNLDFEAQCQGNSNLFQVIVSDTLPRDSETGVNNNNILGFYKNIASQIDRNESQDLGILLSKKEQKRIHNQYQQLYFNRISHLRERQQIVSQEILSPKLSAKSETLAKQKKEKILSYLKSEAPKVLRVDLSDILTFQQSQTEKLLEKRRSQKQQLEESECTFRPQILERQQNSLPRDSTRNGSLHSLAKPKNQRKDKDRQELEYERECDECTFSPDITRCLSAHKSPTIQPRTVSLQKNIYRLKEARLEKQLLEVQAQKGYTFGDHERKQLKQHLLSTTAQGTLKQKTIDKFLNFNKSKANRISLKNGSILKPENNFCASFTNDNQNPLDEHQRKASPQILSQGHQTVPLQPPSNPEKQPIPQEQPARTQQITQESYNQLVLPNRQQYDERLPLLFVDVNIEDGNTARIIVYEGDKSEDLAQKFALEHELDQTMRLRLKELLDVQINGLLTQIDEEVGSFSESTNEK